MRKIISDKNIVNKVKGTKESIKETYFPIYRKKEDFLSSEEREELKDTKEKDELYQKYLKDYHKFCELLFKEIPEFEESINWSECLWKEGLEEQRITINMLIKQYQNQILDFDKINDFIKFIWNYYPELLKENKILINQENEYILYYDDFAEAKDVSDDLVECIEELGQNWKTKHLHNKINSIQLPCKHDISFAEKKIKEMIKLQPLKSFILAKYINKGDEERILFHSLIKKIFPYKLGEIKFVEGFSNEIWVEADNFIIKKIIEEIISWKKLQNIPRDISVDYFNKILNYLYSKNSKYFKNNRLLPSNKGEFKLIDELKISDKINLGIKNLASKLEIFIDEIILNEKIKIKDIVMEKYTLDDLIQKITKNLETVALNEEMAFYLLRFTPLENHLFYNENKDIKDIYKIYFIKEIKNEIIVDTKIESFWQIIKKKVMSYIQYKISKEKNISKNVIDNYIEMLNKYYKYFDFDKYSLLPNIHRELNYKMNLLDYCEIPIDIINILYQSDSDFTKEIMYFGLNVEIQKKNISDFSKILNNIISTIENKKNEQVYKKRYNLYNLFEDLEKPKTISAYEIFYKSVNRIIISTINKKLEKLGNIQNASNYVGYYIEFIKENHEILAPNDYAILPDLKGYFKHLKDLKRNDGIYQELIEIVSKFSLYGDRFDINSILMHEDIKIKEFTPDKSMNNNDISKLINELIQLRKLDPIRILKFLPKKEKQSKQKDIIFLYENVFQKKIKTFELDLEPSFWDITNEEIISKVIKKIEKKSLSYINADEKIAIGVLEKIYKYKNPRTEGEDFAIVPNQNGDLKLYSDLAEEKNISENFKKMLKKFFDCDLNKILKHKILH